MGQQAEDCESAGKAAHMHCLAMQIRSYSCISGQSFSGTPPTCTGVVPPPPAYFGEVVGVITMSVNDDGNFTHDPLVTKTIQLVIADIVSTPSSNVQVRFATTGRRVSASDLTTVKANYKISLGAYTGEDGCTT